jgi:cysteinyl-tRNA synthetase
MMTTSYRHPINYSRENLDEATDRIQYLYDTLERIDRSLGCAGYPADEAPPGDDVELVDEAADTIESFWEDFEAALADDFNTPRAIAVLGRIAKFGNELTQSQGAPEARVAHTIHQIGERLRGAGDVLGILGRTPGEALVEIRDRRVALLGLDADEIEDKIAARRRAREEKDWETADALRDELDEMGVEIMDSPEGTTWRMA